MPNPIGRPTDYTQALADDICRRIEEGSSVRKICLLKEMPNRSSVNKWLGEHSYFSDQYARSCLVRRENKFDKMYMIARDTEDVQRARLLIDVIKWQLSKEEPKKYGDKVDMTTNGKDLPAPILGGLTQQNTDSDINDRQQS